MAEMVPDKFCDRPLAGFRFTKSCLDSWCDGIVRRLRAGLDFPRAMAFEDLRYRLQKACISRDATFACWPDGEGNVYIHFGKRGSRLGKSS